MLISRLDKVRSTGPGSWIACCPAHEDKTPSMTVRDVEDKVLVHCFAGCPAESILGAVGLAFSDLYPEPLPQASKPLRRPFPAADVLEAVAAETLLVAVAAGNLARGMTLTDVDRERLLLAAERILEARRLANG